jgi:hypothetical protein
VVSSLLAGLGVVGSNLAGVYNGGLKKEIKNCIFRKPVQTRFAILLRRKTLL